MTEDMGDAARPLARIIRTEIENSSTPVFVAINIEPTDDGRVMFCIGHSGVVVTAAYAVLFAEQVAAVAAYAQGIEARRAETSEAQAPSQDESPVGNADAPKGDQP